MHDTQKNNKIKNANMAVFSRHIVYRGKNKMAEHSMKKY